MVFQHINFKVSRLNLKKKFNVVCIIPARKGSKGIKLKNLKDR